MLGRGFGVRPAWRGLATGVDTAIRRGLASTSSAARLGYLELAKARTLDGALFIFGRDLSTPDHEFVPGF
jgi:hypothetical protein